MAGSYRELLIEVQQEQGAQVVLQAIESYKNRLRSSIKRGTRRLTQFEERYGVDTRAAIAVFMDALYQSHM